VLEWFLYNIVLYNKIFNPLVGSNGQFVKKDLIYMKQAGGFIHTSNSWIFFCQLLFDADFEDFSSAVIGIVFSNFSKQIHA
jgi:hypothetical protein